MSIHRQFEFTAGKANAKRSTLLTQVKQWTHDAENRIRAIGLHAAFVEVEQEIDEVSTNIGRLDELIEHATSEPECKNLHHLRKQQVQRKDRVLIAQSAVWAALRAAGVAMLHQSEEFNPVTIH